MSKFHRLKQLVQYGWKHAGQISYEHLSKKKRISTFIDILSCYNRYGMWSNQYLKERFWDLDKDQRKIIGNKYCETNRKRETWVKDFYENRAFYIKYGHIKYEKESLRAKRNAAYTKRYGAGKNLSVEYDVNISRQHYLEGTISIGNNVILARNADIDYTGDITIEDNVNISESVKILTHEHEIDFCQRDALRHGAINTPLVIRDNVGIGARAIIMPGVDEIGRGAMISTGAIVKKRVPPYAIVMGNPARVVGFRYPPAIIAEFEEENYPEEERIPLEVLEDNYKKYYLSKIAEIKSFLE